MLYPIKPKEKKLERMEFRNMLGRLYKVRNLKNEEFHHV